ncbi:MAG TPA: KEOPS complex kinase/ATPase Bud32 [Candidatus Nanoarchaeia archaeon]|nr:KEOPS complex kinase/ATPase Bud32 [Candidatus Nanoarchaeia archaeon]
MTSQKIIQQGAEAIIYLDSDKNKILKKRVKKSYRISELDEKIRKLRTRGEAKLLKKASEIIAIPGNIKEDEKNKEISMDFIEGIKLSDELNNFDLKEQKKILQKIGENIAKLHDADIIHGDLTTSNMIFKNSEIFFIDFGLGFQSKKSEDKAVDIHVLKEALEARHFKNWKELFQAFEHGYKKSKQSKQVLERLKAVEKRGRYKH